MAIVDVNLEFERLTLRFEQDIPDTVINSGKVYLLIKDSVGKLLAVPTNTQNFGSSKDLHVILHDPEPFLNLLLPSYAESQFGFLVDDSYVYFEKIQLTSNLLSTIFDPIKLNCVLAKLPEKPGRVAIFTQAFNEGEMLLFWEKYYSGIVGYENLFVLNNGGTDDSCSRLNARTTVVNMPSGIVDHIHFAQTQGYFERFLLQKYDWVVKIDTDEFLVCEGDFVSTLENTAPGIYAPEVALAVVHDRENEEAFCFTGSVSAQRKNFVHEHETMKKPSFACVPITWGPGNHKSAEGYTILKGFWMIHLRYVDFGCFLNRNNRWATMIQSSRDEASYRGIADLNNEMQSIFDITAEELAVMLAKEKVEVPDWLAAKL